MDIMAAREQIDRIDREITRLFCQRMNCSAAIGAYKAEKGLPIHVPAREEEIIAARKKDVTPELEAGIEALYRKIFEISRQYQSHLTGKDDRDD